MEFTQNYHMLSFQLVWNLI